MIVEINLLEKKEKRDIAPIISIIILATLLAILGGFLFLQYQSAKSELATVEGNLSNIEQQIQTLQQKMNEDQPTTAIEDLKVTIDWAKTFPTPTAYLLKHLTALLPERGFILNFSYSDDNVVNLTIQTDTNREMAYYVKGLNESPFVSEVTLKSINTEDITAETEEEAQNRDILQFIPRYVGQLSLKIDADALRAKVIKEDDST